MPRDLPGGARQSGGCCVFTSSSCLENTEYVNRGSGTLRHGQACRIEHQVVLVRCGRVLVKMITDKVQALAVGARDPLGRVVCGQTVTCCHDPDSVRRGSDQPNSERGGRRQHTVRAAADDHAMSDQTKAADHTDKMPQVSARCYPLPCEK